MIQREVYNTTTGMAGKPKYITTHYNSDNEAIWSTTEQVGIQGGSVTIYKDLLESKTYTISNKSAPVNDNDKD